MVASTKEDAIARHSRPALIHTLDDMRLTGRHVLAAAVVVVVAWPSLRVHPTDDFPLSSYPMFTARRGRIASVDVVVGRRQNGRVVRLDPQLIADTDEVMVA